MEKKPEWLRKKISINTIALMRKRLNENKIHTICEEALCPNISECYAKKEASFLILGNICTRRCLFCNVRKYQKPLPVDENEPENVALTVRSLGLKNVVITSPTRDDLKDGGATQFALTIKKIRGISPETKIETLIPDFNGDMNSVKIVIEAKPDIISHNLETVRNLYHIRNGANYEISLSILSFIKENSNIKTKSGIMLGLGEKEEELIELFNDLLRSGCKLLSIGQYIAPSKRHYPVIEYIKPEYFDYLKNICYKMGFEYVESSPYTRSSYNADKYI
ncbi:MAG TPA: lipoyl synthase [Spirochaetota bacterium]|nr:lipoyl synthase [Spirochaetota bacterium]HOL57854.1 lipoyl synthase [Spirochaetota bacterium]HPP05361.1 lipoyl synthase [Spirochaetota bacterium]